MGKLHDAAAKGDVAAIKKLLKGGLFGGARDVNCRSGEWNFTPLHEAAINGQVEAVRVLVAAGADIAAKATGILGYGKTPLHFAADNGHLEAVQALVAAGADVGATNKYSKTPLHYAASWGHVEAVRALVAAGADVGVKDKGKSTPLHDAAARGWVEVVQVLVAAGADVGAKDKDGWTPLHLAAGKGHVEAVQALLAAGADVGVKDMYDWTPLHKAVFHGHGGREVVQALVAAGADVGVKDSDGETPLDLATTDEIRKALSAPPHIPPPVPPPPASAPSAARPPSAPPIAAPASTALELYTGGPVMLPSAGPLTSGQMGGVVAALAKAGLQAAVKVAGGVVTCNPVALVTAPAQLLQAVHALMRQGGLCQQRLQRMKARFAAMEPALVHLGNKLRPPQSAAAPLSIVQSLCANLLLLAHVMAQVQELQSKLQTQGARMLQRMLELLKAGGCEQEVAALDLQLRDALTQLSAVLSIAHFTEATRKHESSVEAA